MWQKIETAPLNRAWWLVWDNDAGRPFVATRRSADGVFSDDDWQNQARPQWFFDVDAPLPAPPEEVK